MAAYRVIAQGNRGEVSRLGSCKTGARATIHSWQTKVYVCMIEQDGKPWVYVTAGPFYSGKRGRVLYDGPESELLP